MSDPTLPAGDEAMPIDPQFEQAFASALHDHARAVAGPVDPSALTARLVRTDKLSGLRRIGFASGAVVVVVIGLLVFGANRRDSEVHTAGSTHVTAVSPARGRPGGPVGSDPVAPEATSDGTTDPTGGTMSDVSIPRPGEVGPDGSTSTTTVATPGGVTTTSIPGAAPTTRPGPPPTTPSGPTPTDPSGPPGPNPTTGPTVAPTTSAPTTTPTSSTPPTTADPSRPPTGPQSSWCAAHLVSPTMRTTTSGTAGAVLISELDFGFAPPLTEITVAGDTAATDRLILSTAVRSDTTGRWSWKIRWNPSATPTNSPLAFTVKCVANGKTVPFTVTRVP